jgi:hypothetical protein
MTIAVTEENEGKETARNVKVCILIIIALLLLSEEHSNIRCKRKQKVLTDMPSLNRFEYDPAPAPC